MLKEIKSQSLSAGLSRQKALDEYVLSERWDRRVVFVCPFHGSPGTWDTPIHPFWTWASRVGNPEEVGMGRGRLEAEKREETLVVMAPRSRAIRKSL